MLDATKATKPSRDPAPTVPESKPQIRCASCEYRITTPDCRVEIQNAHEHTFVNPHGHVFRIGCFSQAPGLRAHGAFRAHYSWFPGLAWRIGVCGGCGMHLGWWFGESGGFATLILDRVVADD